MTAALESAADRAEFLNISDFAVAATYLGSTVNGISDSQFVELNGVESFKPTFLVLATDVPDNPHDQTIVIESINYLIVGHQPDGTGMLLLILELV